MLLYRLLNLYNRGGNGLKLKYLTKPQAMTIEIENGINRIKAIKFVLKELLNESPSLSKIVYVDDMEITFLPVINAGALPLFAPVNAQESVKEIVKLHGGFVSKKETTAAVAEFLTKIYPQRYRKFHDSIHSIWFDMDGILWEEEKIKENYPFFKIITKYIKNCTGPYTARPPISICTGAAMENVRRVLEFLKMKESVPDRFRRSELPLAWPPVLYEEGYLAYDFINERKYDLTEHGLVSSEYHTLFKVLKKLEKEIGKRLLTINKKLKAECKIVLKERSGVCVDLPLEMREGEALKKAHCTIYHEIKDFLSSIPENIKIDFQGILSREELEEELK